MHLHRRVFTKYFVLQSLHKALITACTEYSPVVLEETPFTSYHPFVTHLNSSVCRKKLLTNRIFCAHKSLPTTTLYYKACTTLYYKACTNPVLLCTTKLAQSTFQYYFVLQSLQKLLPGTTLYYKACTKYSPVLLRTTKLAQVRRSTTLYYKPCTRYVPVLQYFYTQQVLSQRRFYTQQAF